MIFFKSWLLVLYSIIIFSISTRWNFVSWIVFVSSVPLLTNDGEIYVDKNYCHWGFPSVVSKICKKLASNRLVHLTFDLTALSAELTEITHAWSLFVVFFLFLLTTRLLEADQTCTEWMNPCKNWKASQDKFSMEWYLDYSIFIYCKYLHF